MNTRILLYIMILLSCTFMFCACGEEDTVQDAGTGAIIPPATDSAPITPDTPAAPAGPDFTVSVPDAGSSQPDPTPLPAPEPELQAIVCIDAGHGGKDPGAVWGDREEKDDTLAMALLVAKYVEEAGHKAVLTRTEDVKMSLEERSDFANESEADIFVSIHRNSFEGAKGVEIWISHRSSDETVEFAENILAALVDVGISKDRGVKKGTQSDPKQDYHVNRETNMPSCLIELGFITSDTDNKLLDDNMDAYAKAIADEAIKEALRITGEAK